ncbi:MAG: hypothetical protein WD696_20535 [Bryobacteraceae bacterium]
MIEQLERLSEAGIQILPASGRGTHFILERGGLVALVERRGDAFGSVGSTGILTPNGMAVLVWRGAEAWFVARGYERLARPEEVTAVRDFSASLANALKFSH